jgi:benzoyl-CoA reductase/2-hydroxyglutaryl-CoA dehydratase subunit BcrC/BadD/HgdB
VVKLPSLAEIETLLEQDPIALSAGRPVVGWFCSYTPLEILQAAGLRTYRIVPGPGRAMARADTVIDRNFCPYVRTCLGEALEGKYKFLDGLVVVNSCDPMRRLFDVWRYNVGGDFVRLLDLPRIATGAAADYFRECLARLVGDIEGHFGVKITESALVEAIARQNRVRSGLKEVYLVNRDKDMPLSAAQLHRVVRAADTLPPELFDPLLERLIVEVRNTSGDYRQGPRLLITGSVLENPRIVDLVEECGGRVVSDDLCTGTRRFWDGVVQAGDPLSALSRHYLDRVPCPRMKDARRRFEHVLAMIDEFGVDGVIFYTLKFCDPYLYDVPLLKARLAERGIPGLQLEGDFTPGTLGRVRTRIEAFIEMLRENVKAA